MGPFVLRDAMNDGKYLTMLRNKTWPVVNNREKIDGLNVCMMTHFHSVQLLFANGEMKTVQRDN